MTRPRLPKDITSLRNLKGSIGKMLRLFKKVSMSSRSRPNFTVQAQVAKDKVSKRLASRIVSLSKALSKSKADKVAKYTKEIVAILEKKYGRIQTKIDKMAKKLEKAYAKKAAKVEKAKKAAKAKAEKAKKEEKAKLAKKAKKAAAKKAKPAKSAKKSTKPAKKSTKPAKKAKSPKKKATRKPKASSMPAAYHLFGGFHELEMENEQLSDLDL